MIVIDSSALIDSFLIVNARSELLNLSKAHDLIAPDHIDIECVNAFRGMERRKKITDESIVIILSALQDLRCVRISSRPLLAEIWSLKNNFSAYDAAYVILAKNTGSTLYTHDKRLANAAKNFVSVARLDQAPAP